ncbi:dTDP-glucose 4,6-dehydratase [Cohnella thailandensis]|uniref:dTDP-glucose 4,6-dehydratase n=1 Tax=Cohnella thailandensis TaxID=557557 RepID=A0A841ST39_9BACL|nr:dTDP-glucose 4,6-dehydratase [Cohnella thailandensis]MBB6635104.1 dTDP-glucose 4,6-dehydratase [Cohnella thailandensis]MBP1974430.1 dTDP-glucose 4,6-dehydratase [Cohnella thailandensis]
MKLLVTGGAGFIGSQFIRYMAAKYPEYRLVNLDKLTYAGNLDNLRELDANAPYAFVRGDIADGELVGKLIGEGGFDAVVNFAAESHVDRSIEDASLFVRTNVLGTQTLLEASRRAGVKKYVQISTDEVYGTLGETGYFTEKTPLAPNSPYSSSKAGADLLVRAYYETYGMNVNITRCSNNYGPYHFPEKLIPLVITNAIEDKPIPVYGDGLYVRDWLHVEDHAVAIDKVLHGGKPGEVYNIGGHNERTNLDIVKFVLKRLGKPETLITHVTDRLGHDRRYAIDASKIREELGWEPAIFLEQGLARTVDWFVQNQEWWRKIKAKE